MIDRRRHQQHVLGRQTGREAFDVFWPVMFQHYEQMFRGIGEEEFSQFVATLQKVLRNIRLAEAE